MRRKSRKPGKDLSSDKEVFLSRLSQLSGGKPILKEAAKKAIEGPSGPREWHVSEKGKDTGKGTARSPLATIQAAVDAANPGDRIIVGPGVFQGAALDKPGLSIIGAGEQTVITGSGEESAGFDIGPAVSGIRISHFSFRGVLFPVYACGLEDSEISYLTMDGPFQGITCLSCNRCRITHNRIIGLRPLPDESATGILLAASAGHGGSLKGNLVAFNHIEDGAEFTGPGEERVWNVGIEFGNLDLPSGGQPAVSGNEIVHNSVAVSNGEISFEGQAVRKGLGISFFDDSGHPSPGEIIRSNRIRFNSLAGSGSPIEVEDEGFLSSNDVNDDC